jgi:hypothetical protein
MDYLSPIIDEFETILKVNLNTKIQAIDASVKTVLDSCYSKSSKMFPKKFPFVSIFSMGDAPVENVHSGGTIEIDWPIFVTVDVLTKSEEELHRLLGIYNSAVIESVVQGTDGQPWALNAVVERMRLTRASMTGVEGENGTFVGGCFTQWECLMTHDPTT